MPRVNFDTAKAILEDVHRAWSAGDIDATLRTFTDDIWFQRNAPDSESAPLIILGREMMEVFLRTINAKTTGMAVLKSFQFHAGIGRASVSYFLKDRDTGQTLSGTHRQIVMFRQMQISRMEQFHDAARLAAFFRLINAPACATVMSD